MLATQLDWWLSVRNLNCDGVLQLGELVVGGDVIGLAAREIGALPDWVSCPVAAGRRAAAFSTADGLLLTIDNALAQNIYSCNFKPGASASSRVITSKVLVMVIALLAGIVAALKIIDILQCRHRCWRLWRINGCSRAGRDEPVDTPPWRRAPASDRPRAFPHPQRLVMDGVKGDWERAPKMGTRKWAPTAACAASVIVMGFPCRTRHVDAFGAASNPDHWPELTRSIHASL